MECDSDEDSDDSATVTSSYSHRAASAAEAPLAMIHYAVLFTTMIHYVVGAVSTDLT